jgi:hypothetical protein
MIHYSCDRCHREIDSEIETRYSVQIECRAILAASDHEVLEQDEDRLAELNEMLERLEEEPEPRRRSLTQCHQFDLCDECYKAYVRNPLARDVPVSIEFSEN